MTMCDWCNGTKKLEIEYRDGGKESSPCPRCSGTGAIDLAKEQAAEQQLKGMINSVLKSFPGWENEL